MVEIAEVWSGNPLYSHGYLVPAFALYLLWHRRDQMPAFPSCPSLWGFVFVALGMFFRLSAAYFYLSWPDRISMLPVLIGICLVAGGWPVLRWTGPSIAFLIFMIPLPGALETGLTRPLQRMATLVSVNILQGLGLFAQADGNVIVLSEVDMGVVEACSGLRMLTVFVAQTVAVGFFLDRPLWQRILVVLSALPIALACNVARITTTGVLYEIAPHDVAQLVFHDVAGWLMMPLALLILFAELALFSKLFILLPNLNEPPQDSGFPPLEQSSVTLVGATNKP